MVSRSKVDPKTCRGENLAPEMLLPSVFLGTFLLETISFGVRPLVGGEKKTDADFLFEWHRPYSMNSSQMLKSLQGCEKWILCKILHRSNSPKNPNFFIDFFWKKMKNENVFLEIFSKKHIFDFFDQKKSRYFSDIFCFQKKSCQYMFWEKFPKNIFSFSKIIFFRWKKSYYIFWKYWIDVEFYGESIFRILGAIFFKFRHQR